MALFGGFGFGVYRGLIKKKGKAERSDAKPLILGFIEEQRTGILLFSLPRT
jgi:hypothetical protein